MYFHHVYQFLNQTSFISSISIASSLDDFFLSLDFSNMDLFYAEFYKVSYLRFFSSFYLALFLILSLSHKHIHACAHTWTPPHKKQIYTNKKKRKKKRKKKEKENKKKIKTRKTDLWICTELLIFGTFRIKLHAYQFKVTSRNQENFRYLFETNYFHVTLNVRSISKVNFKRINPWLFFLCGVDCQGGSVNVE